MNGSMCGQLIEDGVMLLTESWKNASAPADRPTRGPEAARSCGGSNLPRPRPGIASLSCSKILPLNQLAFCWAECWYTADVRAWNQEPGERAQGQRSRHQMTARSEGVSGLHCHLTRKTKIVPTGSVGIWVNGSQTGWSKVLYSMFSFHIIIIIIVIRLAWNIIHSYL